MRKRRIAYLAPELPSGSTAFLHEEINHLTEAGYTVTPFSLKRVARKGLPNNAVEIAHRTTALQANPASLLFGALKFALTHPARTWRCLSLAAADYGDARFDGRETRMSLLPAAITALTLADRLITHDVKHLHVHFSDVPATIGMYAAAAADIPFSVTAHDTDLYCEASLLDKKIERASAFTTVSRANRGYLLERLGTLAAKVCVIYSGIDVTTFPARRAESGEGSNVVFASGPLLPRKGFDVLLYALALLGDTRPDIRVAIAGDGKQRRRLEQLAERLHVGDRVSLLGSVSRDDIRTHLAAAGCFALPCRAALSGDRDAIPVSLIEAMACSVPVVSSRFSGIPELVEHEQSGLLVDPDDPVDLAAAIVRLLDDSALRKTCQQAARKRVEDQFDLAGSTRALADVFEAAIDRHDEAGRRNADSETPIHRDFAADERAQIAGAVA
jgi:glycosyltransferase involved in cell wall biosynthesis